MMVALALLFGVSAAVGVNSFLKNPPSAQGDVVPVVVAAADLPRGGNITAELLKVKEFPKDAVPAGALSKTEDAVNRGVSIPLLKDDPVLEGKLTPKGAGRGMAALVPNGMRAYTIQTPNVAQGVAGFILPGNRVDVLLAVAENTVFGGTQIPGGTTTMLLQNVEILAVDQKTDAPAENKVDSKELRSVTLLVAPQQANLLTLGQKKGELYLALRNLKDHEPARTHPATLDELRFHQETPWDERAKGVLEALGKAFAQIKIQPKAAEAKKAPQPPSMVAIRTIRGRHEGAVFVQMPSTSRTERQSQTMGALGARN
jgi:pilus assembly protein CpaB